MSQLLFVPSSLVGEASVSRRIASEFIAAWRADRPDAKVVVRDVAADPVPHLTQASFAAGSTPPDQRSPEQRIAAALGDTLIAEVEASQVIVLAAPMYNFTIPTPLKAWFDHIARAGRTFTYTADGGPKGLLGGRKAVVVTTRGGIYGEGPFKGYDQQEPYLRTMFGFLGITDVQFVHVEGQNMAPSDAVAGAARARAAIAAMTADRAAA